ESAFGQSRQRHDRAAEVSEFLWRDVALGFPKRIQHTNERCALAEIIVEIEQLKTAEAWRAQVGFDFLLVALDLETSGGPGKIAILIQHTFLLRDVFEDVVVARAQIAGEFFYNIEIGIRAPLADFVAEHWNMNVFKRIAIVASEPAGGVAQA